MFLAYWGGLYRIYAKVGSVESLEGCSEGRHLMVFTPFTQITLSVHVMDYSKRAYLSGVHPVIFLSEFTHALQDMGQIKNDVAAGNRQMLFPKSFHPFPRDSFRFRNWYSRNGHREENSIYCNTL